MGFYRSAADRIARKIIDNAEHRGLRMNQDAVRDYCDIETGADLDTLQLDLLTEMVERRLGHKYFEQTEEDKLPRIRG